MKKAEIKGRIDKVDDRVKVLIKKYPFVFAGLVGASMIVGIGVGIIIGISL